ncbi:MAG: small multi-drug export protein [Gracilibacteraceae bacterium]|jgi:uncharacterized membrane protein|nr:small multi-drug export protein [Gracilibacteraceae bacterium]
MSMVESVSSFLAHYVSPPVVVFLISMLPVLELRGGMVAAALFGMPWPEALLASLLGNMLPIPFVILFIRRVIALLGRGGPLRSFALWLVTKGTAGGARLQERYPRSLWLGLCLFVAIPLPGTGAWTGALIAALLGLKAARSASAICVGVLGAAGVMSLLTYVLPALVRAV